MRKRHLNICSISTLWPDGRNPQAGLFIRRRVEALSQLAAVRLLRPSPWFPLVKPDGKKSRQLLQTRHLREFRSPKMFYIPRYFKPLDAYWLERSIYPSLKEWHAEQPIDAIDAHFGYPTGAGCFRAGRRLGIPVFITIRGLQQEFLTKRTIGHAAQFA